MLRKALRRACIPLALAAAGAPLDSAAYQARFEGWLVSDNASDAPIHIVLDLELNPVGLSGTVKTAPPLAAAGVVNGNEQFGTCDLRSDLSRLALLKMKGPCVAYMASFNGAYSLYARDGKRQVGVFRLTRTSSGDAPSTAGPGTAGEVAPERSSLTPTRCIRANSACLVACPRGDYNAELLCVNRCKQKLKVCKASRPLTPDAPPTPANE
jgi:hypothetical protein